MSCFVETFTPMNSKIEKIYSIGSYSSWHNFDVFITLHTLYLFSFSPKGHRRRKYVVIYLLTLKKTQLLAFRKNIFS